MTARNRATRILIIDAVLLTVVVFAIVLHTQRRRRAAALRMIQYQAQVHQYSEILPLGTTRAEINRYLHARGMKAFQMCCVSTHHRGWSELLKIGQESAPWYCSEENIYVGLEFDSTQSQESANEADGDPLADVTLFPWLEGCL
jgi:hypothetical protein